jgi:hypothetical protein
VCSCQNQTSRRSSCGDNTSVFYSCSSVAGAQDSPAQNRSGGNPDRKAQTYGFQWPLSVPNERFPRFLGIKNRNWISVTKYRRDRKRRLPTKCWGNPLGSDGDKPWIVASKYHPTAPFILCHLEPTLCVRRSAKTRLDPGYPERAEITPSSDS